jgi:hypothetical protein
MIKILEKQRLGFVATVDNAGAPCLSPEGTFVAVSNTTIASVISGRRELLEPDLKVVE